MGGSTSEVASCNYVARARGVYKGQWLGEAMVLCPDLIALPYDFEGIEEATQGLFECLLAVSRRILPVSCDEVRDSWSSFSRGVCSNLSPGFSARLAMCLTQQQGTEEA